MPDRSVSAWVAVVGTMCLLAAGVRAQEPKLDSGMEVMARSPDFVLKDGPNVVPLKSKLNVFFVERVEGNGLRLYIDGA